MIRLAIVDQDPADIHFLGKSERTEKTRHYVLLNWKFFKRMEFAVLSILLYKYTDPGLSCFREGEHPDEEIIKIAEQETERLRPVSPYLGEPFHPTIAKRLESAIKKTGEKGKLGSVATEFCKSMLSSNGTLIVGINLSQLLTNTKKKEGGGRMRTRRGRRAKKDFL